MLHLPAPVCAGISPVVFLSATQITESITHTVPAERAAGSSVARARCIGLGDIAVWIVAILSRDFEWEVKHS